MSNIKIGEYIRTNEGEILKYDIEHEKAYIDNFLMCPHIMKERIVKHSKDVIDLIEVGDYVNGLEVYKGKVASGEEKLLIGNHMINGMSIEVVNIKSILTKEQYEQNCYRLEG